jgi:hypothetical protein
MKGVVGKARRAATRSLTARSGVRRPLAGLLIAALVTIATGGLLPTPTAAQNDPVVTIRKVVEAWLQGRHKIDEVTQTPMKNMYEVRIGQ